MNYNTALNAFQSANNNIMPDLDTIISSLPNSTPPPRNQDNWTANTSASDFADSSADISNPYKFFDYLKSLEDQAVKQQQDYNLSSAQKAMDFSASEAQKTRDWQEYMSNTSYQRAMTDLRKAGLNPVLAYTQGGASTPAGSTGTGYSTSSAKAEYNKDNIASDMFSLIVNSALKVKELSIQETYNYLNALGKTFETLIPW